jgi:hypothetical protein
MRRLFTSLLLASVAAAAPAGATVALIAKGAITSTTDLSGLTGTLENGLPANILGGIGSGLTYAGGNTFIAVPDRGPNATPYNSSVDDTVSYISRLQTLTMSLTATPTGGLPYTLVPALTKTTLLSSATPLVYGTGAGLGNKANGQPLGSGAPSQNSAGTYYFTGRSDNFAPGLSTDPANARFDPESVRISNDGKSVFISDEYGPYVRQFDRATGKLIKTFAVPGDLAVANQSPNGATEIAGNATGRVANKGMEGLALTPDGKTLVGIMQAPLEQDASVAATSKMVRIVTIDIASGTTHEYGYNLTTGSGVSDIVAINDHQFLVDERDGKGLGDGSKASVKQLFQIDIAGATDIKGLTGAQIAALTGPNAIHPVSKDGSPFLDVVAQLTNNGFTKSTVPAKIEGISFGQDIVENGQTLHTLYVANDNDFVPDSAGPNQFFVFSFADGDLPGYVAQALNSAVPEPASWGMMVAGFGLLGGALRWRKAVIGVTFG